jgi:Family of unknown function (DUF6882)
MTKLIEYLEHYALTTLEKQDRLALLVGEHTFELDLDGGKARFGETLEFPFQVLGTESDNTLTWLWAWADEQAEVPLSLLSSAFQLKDWGEKNGVKEFIVPSVDLAAADGHAISLIAAGVCGASCFYRDRYEGGGAFVLIFDKRIDAQPSFDLPRFIRKFLDLSSRAEFNHRRALAAYFRAKGLRFTETGTLTNGELVSGERVNAEFDGAGTLISLNGEEIR